MNEARFEVQLGWAFRWQQPQWTSQWKLRRDSRQKLSSQARSEFLSQKILPRVKQLFYFKLGVNLSSINKKLEHLQHSWFLLHPLGSFCGGEVRWGQGCRVSLTFSEGFFVCLFWFLSGFFFFFASPNGMQDLSSLTRDWTCAPCIGSTVLTTELPGKSPVLFFNWPFVYLLTCPSFTQGLWGSSYRELIKDKKMK